MYRRMTLEDRISFLEDELKKAWKRIVNLESAMAKKDEQVKYLDENKKTSWEPMYGYGKPYMPE